MEPRPQRRNLCVFGWPPVEGQLWQAIQIAEWDNLILQDFVASFKRDTDTFFFQSQDLRCSRNPMEERSLVIRYHAFNPQSMILIVSYELGPLGNGKTESIKVLLKGSGIPSLYVKSAICSYVGSNLFFPECIHRDQKPAYGRFLNLRVFKRVSQFSKTCIQW